MLVVSVSKPRWDSEEHPRRGTLANAQLDVELFLGAGRNRPSTVAVLCPSPPAGRARAPQARTQQPTVQFTRLAHGARISLFACDAPGNRS